VHTDSNSAWAGMDVGSKAVDIAVILQGKIVEQWQCVRTQEALQKAGQRLVEMKVGYVVLEATGGLERLVGSALLAVGVTALRVNGKWVRDFAKAKGVLAKTDRIDARMLALYGERMQPAVRQWLDADRQQLAEWIARERDLVDLCTAESNRLKRIDSAGPGKSIQRHLDFLAKELKKVAAERSEWWDQHAEAWAESEARLRTMPGIGPKTARVLIAYMPELGQANRRQIASLAGLAPIACESGQRRGQRHIRGGRAVVRSALYLASWTTVRRDATFRAFYEEMVGRGKPRQLALIAVARRMLVALNDMIRNQRDWQSRAVSA
jgi:transposase